MAIALEPLIFDSFKGLREYNGINAGGQISAIDCKNVELIQTEIGNATGIKTMAGNAVLYTLPDNDYEILGVFKSEQDGILYEFIYAENNTQGRLYYIDITKHPVSLISTLPKTGECNGITMTSTAYDVFIFTNGVDAYSICFTDDVSYGSAVKEISTGASPKTDYLGNEIHFLAMSAWNGFLVVATDYGVRASHQNDIYTWNDNPDDIADSWYIDFTKKVTALYSYTGGLYIFTSDDITYINTTPNDTANSVFQTVAGVGCMSYTSIVKHDTFLFFYDNIQKNIYYIQNIDNGQTRPAGPAAREIQSAFRTVKALKMYSCIYDNKNEIWCLITDVNDKQTIYIYNYVQSEWVKREEQTLASLCLFKNTIHTAHGKTILKEFLNNSYNDLYYASMYQTCFINAGSNTNLKKQKTPLLLVLNDSYINDFWVQLTVNGKAKNPKRVKLKTTEGGVYGDINEELDILPGNQTYDVATYGAYNPYSKKVVEISTPQTWYTMSVKVYTDRLGQGFCISSMELKNMKAKLKTRGR